MGVGSRDRQLFLDGVDITRFTEAVAVGAIQWPEWGSIPTAGQASFRVASETLTFRPWHPTSILYGTAFAAVTLELFQGGNPRWIGFLEDTTTDPGAYRAELRGETALTRALTRNGRVDTTATNPASAAKRLLKLQGVDVDETSFALAESILNAVPLRIQVRPDVVEWDGTTSDILQLLANAGILRFTVLPSGAVGCQTWVNTGPPGAMATITDDVIQAQFAQENIEYQPVDGWKIVWLHAPATDASIGNNVLSLDFGANSAVQMLDAESANYCGEVWKALHATRYSKLSIRVDRTFGLSIIEDDWVRLDSAQMGLQVDLQVDGYDDSDDRWITIFTRFERPEPGAVA